MKSGKFFLVAMVPAISAVFLTLILTISSCASSLSEGGGGGGGGGGGSSSFSGLVDGTNFVNTTNTFYFNATGSNAVTNNISNGYTVTIVFTGDFTNDITHWILELSNNQTITNGWTSLSNTTNNTTTCTVYYVVSIEAYDTTNVWPPLMVSNVTTNSNSIAGGFEVFVTNYGWITNAVTNWLTYYTNSVMTETVNTNQYYFEAVSNTYLRYTNGFVTNAFDTTNLWPPLMLQSISTNSNSIANGFEVTVTNFYEITNVVTNWLEEVVNGSVTVTWSTNTYFFNSASNVVAVYTNTFITNAYSTTNAGTDIWVSNITTNSNSIANGFEVYELQEGYVTNTVTNWLSDYTNGVLNNTWSTNTYEFLALTNVQVVLYTNTYTTNIENTTNAYGSPIGTNNTTNEGFVGKFWYTNINVNGYYTNLITNWVVAYTDGVVVSSNYSNYYYMLDTTNYSTSNSNFGVQIGSELASDANTIALWGFNEGSGQSVADASANGRNLTIGATSGSESTDPTWTNWYSGAGYRVGSYSNSLNFYAPDSQYAWWNGIYSPGASITIGFWMKTTNNTGILMSAGLSNYQVHLDNNNIYFTVNNFTTYYIYGVSAANITNGKWHYIACTYPNGGGNRSRIFIDGVQNQNGTGSTGFAINNVTNIYVGGRPDFGTYFNGMIDCVQIKNNVVAGATITANFTTATNQ